MIKINRTELRDKITACWIGKNIGGTIGGPYEHKHDFLDVKGFSTQPGVPLPNDDLDLQLVWLLALEKEGPFHFSSRTLAEYIEGKIAPDVTEYCRKKLKQIERKLKGKPPMPNSDEAKQLSVFTRFLEGKW